MPIYGMVMARWQLISASLKTTVDDSFPTIDVATQHLDISVVSCPCEPVVIRYLGPSVSVYLCWAVSSWP